MKTYEKPSAEIVSFESERIMDDLGIGEMPEISEAVEVW